MTDVGSLVKALFGRRWWWVTIIVLLLMAVLARLGVWQLHRLEQRRAANAILSAALDSPPIDLNVADPATLATDPATLKDRDVTAQGTYDYDNELILKLQNYQGQPGVHLVTPLVLSDGRAAVLIDRGWVPDEEVERGNNLAAYRTGSPATINGYLALSQPLRRATGATAEVITVNPQGLREVYRIDIAALQKELPYTLLPIYVIEAPGEEGNPALPYRPQREVDLSEGPHLGYAFQWFTFSLGLGIAYVLYVNKKLAEERAEQPAA